MKAVISRASVWDDEVPPCDEAVLSLVKTRDIRDRGGEYWLQERWPGCTVLYTEDGYPYYEYTSQAWIIEFNDLDAFKAFVAKEHRVIVTHGDYLGRMVDFHITIYDDYIE